MLLERDAELAELAERVRRLREGGEGGAALIEGPPGIGKSALLAAALNGAGVEVLRARGSELESGLAFGAVRQLLVPVLRDLDPEEREVALGGPARLAARVLGLAEESAELTDPLFSLHWLLGELAARRPLIVAIDDLHWLDEESGRFAGYLARRLEGEPILLLATARPREPGATAPTIEADVIRPAPLSAPAIGLLVEGRDAEAAHRATGGNPLLATQLAQAPADVPLEEVALKGVGEMVLARVERLSEPAGRLARAASLFTDRPRLEDLAAVAELTPGEAADAADGLVGAQVLTEALGFLHPVMRTAVYGTLGPFARRAAHGTAARVLRRRGAPVEAIAGHLLHSAPEQDPEAVRLLRDAATAAVASAAPRAGIRYLERALEEGPGEGRFDLLLEIGSLQGRLGRPEAEETLRRAAEAAPDPHAAADAAIHRAAVLLAANRNQEALAELAGRQELDAEQTLLAEGLRAGAAMELGRRELFHAIVDRLPADLPGDTTGQRLAMTFRWMRDFGNGMPPGEALDRLLDCLADDGGVAFAEYGLTTFDPVPCFNLLGAFPVIEHVAEGRMAAARDNGDEAGYLSGLLARCGSLAMRGHWRRAEADAREIAEHPGATTDHLVMAWDHLVEILARQGRVEEAREALERLAGLEAGAYRVELRRAVVGEVTDGSGYEHFKVMADLIVGLGWTHPGQRRWLCSYADGLLRDGRAEQALAVMEEYLREAEPTGDPASVGQALTVLAKAGRDVERAGRAVAVLEPSPHEWLLGWARLELGAALRRDNRRAEARPHLLAALAYATEHGEAHIERRAIEELELAGGKTREATERDRDALTPAEARVARLAAGGLSNKQIAAELFLTVGSVQTTLIRVFRKLGINSRRDLPLTLGAMSDD